MHVLYNVSKNNFSKVEALFQKAKMVSKNWTSITDDYFSSYNYTRVMSNNEIKCIIKDDFSYIALDEKCYEDAVRIDFLCKLSERYGIDSKPFTFPLRNITKKNTLLEMDLSYVNEEDLMKYINISEKLGLANYTIEKEDKKIILTQIRNFSIDSLIDFAVYKNNNNRLKTLRSVMKTLFDLFQDLEVCPSTILNYERQIVEKISAHNLSWLKALGEEGIEVSFYNTIIVSRNNKEKTIDKIVKTLNSKGYKTNDDLDESDLSKSLRTYANYNKKVRKYPDYVDFDYNKFYDHKYNDGSLTYYRHICKRHILQDMLPTTTNAKIVNVFGDEIIIDQMLNVPYLTKNTFKRTFEERFLIHQLIQDGKNNLGKNNDLFIVYNDYGIKIAKTLLKRFSFNETLNIFKNGLDCSTHQTAHDTMFRWDEIIEKSEKFLTNKALKIILSKKGESLEWHHNQLKRVPTNKKIDKKALRKELSTAIKRNERIDVILDRHVHESLIEFLKKKKIKNADKAMVFIEKMRVYNPSVNIETFFSVMKKHGKTILEEKMEGLFEAETFYPNTACLATLIKEILSTKNRKSKKLYTKLNQLHSVKSLVDGDVPYEKTLEIISVLKTHGYEIKFSSLPLFYGKIEPKCSPEFLTAGDASKCCMGFGTDKAITYAVEKGFGIFNIYYKDNVIANSVIWINKEENALVIDNIEVNDNYLKFEEYIKNLYSEMIHKTVTKYNLTLAVQGDQYNDLKLFDNKEARFKLSLEAAAVNSKFYSDAKTARLVYSIERLTNQQMTNAS